VKDEDIQNKIVYKSQEQVEKHFDRLNKFLGKKQNWFPS